MESGTEESPHAAPRKGMARLGFLAAEVVVVFLGVWSAFLLDGCRERRADEARRQLILESLRHDLEQLDGELSQAAEWFERTFVAGFLEPLEAGEKPLPKPIPLPAGEADEGWNAIVASGGLEVLDLELIRAVERLIGTTRWMASTAGEYNAYVRTILVPDLGGEADVELFYAEGSDDLRGKYLWYYYSLRSLQQAFEQLRRQLEELEQILNGPASGESLGSRTPSGEVEP
ncbi:MAG: hypothetical protein MI919_03040 [Holophagales bacterium]|nr:hypothetical protein [Holophagales bacterium]